MAQASNGLALLIAFHLAVVITALDIHVPCLSMMVDYFDGTQSTLQLTISLYAIGSCIGSLIFGPLADAIGRRKSLTFALIGIIASSLLCAFSSNAELLVAARFLQGFFGSACPVISIALTADLYKGHRFTQITSLNGLMITAALAIAPVIGSHIGTQFGWRYIFIFLSIALFISGVILLKVLPETLLQKRSFNAKQTFSEYRKMITNFRFIGYGALPSFVLGAIIAYLGSAAYYFIDELRMHETVFSYFQFAALTVNALANLATGMLVPKFGARTLLKFGIALVIIGAIWMGLTSILTPTSPYLLTSAQVMINIAIAIIFAGATTFAMQAVPQSFGTASALMGALRMFIISIMATASGYIYAGTAITMSLVFILSLFLCFSLYLLVIRHEGIHLPATREL